MDEISSSNPLVAFTEQSELIEEPSSEPLQLEEESATTTPALEEVTTESSDATDD